MNNEDLLTPVEAMAYLKLGRNTFYTILKEDEEFKKTRCKIGKTYRYSKAKIDQYIQNKFEGVN